MKGYRLPKPHGAAIWLMLVTPYVVAYFAAQAAVPMMDLHIALEIGLWWSVFFAVVAIGLLIAFIVLSFWGWFSASWDAKQAGVRAKERGLPAGISAIVFDELMESTPTDSSKTNKEEA